MLVVSGYSAITVSARPGQLESAVLAYMDAGDPVRVCRLVQDVLPSVTVYERGGKVIGETKENDSGVGRHHCLAGPLFKIPWDLNKAVDSLSYKPSGIFLSCKM